MYVCVCQAVTEREIHAARRRGVRTLSELTEETGVASCCGSCADEAEELLVADARRGRLDHGGAGSAAA